MLNACLKPCILFEPFNQIVEDVIDWSISIIRRTEIWICILYWHLSSHNEIHWNCHIGPKFELLCARMWICDFPINSYNLRMCIKKTMPHLLRAYKVRMTIYLIHAKVIIVRRLVLYNCFFFVDIMCLSEPLQVNIEMRLFILINTAFARDMTVDNWWHLIWCMVFL